MSTKLLMPREVDGLLRYPRGRSQRLAKKNKLPHIVLPDGEIRFPEEEINKLLRPPERTPGEEEVAHVP
jgi:hypothetical protein